MAKDENVIGFVSSTIAAPANESRFDFIIKKDNSREVCSLNQFDLIKVERDLPGQQEKDYLIAVVESVASYTDAPDHMANYVSQNFGTGDGFGVSRAYFYCATAKVLTNKEKNYFPVKTGDKVYKAANDDVYQVLYSNYDEEKDNYFKIAKMRMYGKENYFVLLNKKYLIGPDGVHLNVSGMSGVASKTTKAMTILRELFLSDTSVSLVIFNTKNRDLLNLQTKGELAEDYVALESEIERDPKDWNSSIETYIPLSSDEPGGYILDFKTQQEKKNIDMLTAMDPDDYGTMDSCIKKVHDKKAYASITEDDPFNKKFSGREITKWQDLQDVQFAKKDKIRESTSGKFRRVVSRVLTDDALKGGIFSLNDVSKDITIIIGNRLKESKPTISVIDIAPLDYLKQGVVFGSVMREIKLYCDKTARENKKHVVVFIDEFNKYASIDTSSKDPILETLIDIAETGRGIGLCMVTAEQSLSIINPRIKANYSNQIFGRTGVLELTQLDYMMIPDSYKSRIGTFGHEDALVYTTYLNSNLIYAKFPDRFYDEG